MKSWMFGTGAAVAFLVVAGSGLSGSAVGQQETAMVLTMNTDLMREALKPLGFDWEEVQDEDGLMSFHMKEGGVTRFVIYQYRVSAETPVDSLGISAGYDLQIRLDPRQMNQWNSTTRFSKAYVDSDGDPFLTSDMRIRPGVSLGAVTEYVRGFRESQVEFEKVVLNRN